MQFRAGPLLLEQLIKRGPSIIRPRLAGVEVSFSRVTRIS